MIEPSSFLPLLGYWCFPPAPAMGKHWFSIIYCACRQLVDAERWYSSVRISADRFVSVAALEKTLEALITAGVLPKDLKVEPASLVDDRLGELRDDIKSMRLYQRPELVCLLFYLFPCFP